MPIAERAPVADVYHETLALAKQLIACSSVSPSDAGALDLLGSRLSGSGFTCERIDRRGVGNLWATHGEGAPLVCLAGHVDVVPPGPIERWRSDPFLPTERDGFLFGRGAADMKTSVAAMVTAAERVVAGAPDHRGSVALLFTSDEEGDAADGTVAVVERLQSRGVTIDACIVGEPTSSARLGDVVKNGRRGSLTGALMVKGVQCHIAYPELGQNPVHAAVPALAELAAATWDDGDEYFAPTSFQIAHVHAGTGASNIIPGTFDVLFNFRFSPASTAEALQARVRSILDKHGLDWDLRWTLVGTPFLSPPGRLVDVLRRSITEVTGIVPKLSTSGGTSDGRFLAAISRGVVEFGPVNASIHAIDEHVALADIAPLSRVYEQAIVDLLRP